MKKLLLLLLVLSFTWVNGQIVYTSEYCPEENVTVYFSFQSPSRYSISETDLKGVSIIQNITAGGSPSPYTCYAVIKFADKKGPHQFKIYDHSERLILTNAHVFKRVKTLEGNKPKWDPYPPPSVSPFGEWDDVFDISSVGGPCKTQPFTYTAPEVNYKDSDGTMFGSVSMNLYEWLLPKGFKIGNEVSDGVNVITTVSSAATITPDPISWGEIKVRATNNCSPYTLKKSDWYRIKLLHRYEMRLSVDGANPIQVACDDVTLRTFTLENGELTCVSGYAWTIGNNWRLEDGSPAPATLTTTSPLLKLKPLGTAAPGSVKVRPIVNGEMNVNEMTCNVTFVSTPPAPFSIPGDNEICSGSKTFTVTSTNNNTTWNISSQPAGIMSYTTNGNSITITKAANKSGTVTLYSTIQNNCGAQTTSARKTITIGAPQSSSLTAFWDDIGKIRAFASEVPGAKYEWTLNDVYAAQTTDYITSIPSRAWNKCTTVFDVGLNVITTCGTSQRQYYRIGLPPCDAGGGKRKAAEKPSEVMKDSSKAFSIDLKEAKYKIAPNPVISYLEIYANTATSQLIREIVILDQLGVIKKKVNMGKGVTTAKINVQELAKGLYFVRIYDGKEWSSQQVLVGK